VFSSIFELKINGDTYGLPLCSTIVRHRRLDLQRTISKVGKGSKEAIESLTKEALTRGSHEMALFKHAEAIHHSLYGEKIGSRINSLGQTPYDQINLV
jgi:hypothetical protein